MRGYKLNLRDLIKDLGGPMKCWKALQDVGIDVQYETLKKWQLRDDIAVVYLVNLMAHRALHDGPLDLNNYIVPVRDPRGPKLVRSPRPQPAPSA